MGKKEENPTHETISEIGCAALVGGAAYGGYMLGEYMGGSVGSGSFYEGGESGVSGFGGDETSTGQEMERPEMAEGE